MEETQKKDSFLQILKNMNESVLKEKFITIMNDPKVAEFHTTNGMIFLEIMNDSGAICKTIKVEDWTEDEKTINEFVQHVIEIMGISNNELFITYEVEEGLVLMTLPPFSSTTCIKIRKYQEWRNR